MTKTEYFLFKKRQALTPRKNDSKKDFSKNYYLKNLKRITNLIRLHRKANEEKDYEKMAYIESKLTQLNCYYVCKQLHSQKYLELLHKYDAQIKVINYIEKEGFISPEFQNVGLKFDEILKTCKILTDNGILKRRNCTGIAYEFKEQEFSN